MIKKTTYIICAFLILFFLIWLFIDYKNIKKEYFKTFYYLDTFIDVRIYSNKSVDKVFNGIENIFSEYDKLISTDKEYEGIINVYTINNTNEVLTIDKKLHDLISYGMIVFSKTNGLININMNSVVEKWNDFLTNKGEVPIISYTEDIDINNISLLKDYKIEGGLNLNLYLIAKGYITKIVQEYLTSVNINDYIINIGGDVVLGNSYNDTEYSIALEKPYDNSVYDLISCTNKAVVTRGTYNKFYKLNDIYYTDIINGKTLSSNNYFKSVTVIGEDINTSSMLATVLYMMDLEEGKEFLKDFINVKVYWYTYSDEIIMEET